MALCKQRRKTLTIGDTDISVVCTNAVCTFSLGAVQINLSQFIADNPHIPMRFNRKTFAAAFHTTSRTIEQQRRYMATQIDPFDVTAENSRWLEDSNSNVTILLFEKGNVVLNGAKDEASAKLAAYQFCEMLNRHTSLCVTMTNFKICNQVVFFEVPFHINLEALSTTPQVSNRVSYDPNDISMAIFHARPGEEPPTPDGTFGDDQDPPTSKRAALISPAGPVIVTGPDDLQDAVRFMRRVFPYLLMNRTEPGTVPLPRSSRRRRNPVDSMEAAQVLWNVVWRTDYGSETPYADPSDMVKLGKRSASTALTTRNVSTSSAPPEMTQLEVFDVLQNAIEQSYNGRAPPKKRARPAPPSKVVGVPIRRPRLGGLDADDNGDGEEGESNQNDNG